MRNLIFLILALAALSLKVDAIAVASDYLPNGALELIEGTSKIYSIRLQNPTDYEVGIRVDYDATFMKVIDYKEVYTLAPHETGYGILFNITAPKSPGIYSVEYTVSEVEPASGGGLGIRLKINKSLNIKVIQDPDKFHIKNEHIAYAVVIVSFLLYVFMKKRIKKRSKYKPEKFLK